MSVGVILRSSPTIKYTFEDSLLITETGTYPFRDVLDGVLPAQLCPDSPSVSVVFGGALDNSIVSSLIGSHNSSQSQIEDGVRCHEVQVARDSAKLKIYAVSEKANSFNWDCVNEVLHRLARGATYVPYRNTRLTRLLWPSLHDAKNLIMYIHLPMDATDHHFRQLALAESVATWDSSGCSSFQQYVPVSVHQSDLPSLKDAVYHRLEQVKSRYSAEFLPKLNDYRRLVAQKTAAAEAEAADRRRALSKEVYTLTFEMEQLYSQKQAVEAQLCRNEIVTAPKPESRVALRRENQKREAGSKHLVEHSTDTEARGSDPMGDKSPAGSSGDITVDPWDLLFSAQEAALRAREAANDDLRQQIATVAAELCQRCQSLF